MYYRIADGKLTFKITKSNKGTIIDQYDKGQLTDTFEYDENSIAIMGMEGIDSLDENYVENFFDSQVPYFETKNKEKKSVEIKDIRIQNRAGRGTNIMIINLDDEILEAQYN